MDKETDMTAPVLEIKQEGGGSLAAEVALRSGQPIFACYQCRRCAAGCPVGIETGYVTPDRLIRMIILGDREAALNNQLVWKCVSCYTCGTRCPNDIQTARITETLKHMAKEAHLTPLSPKVANFHDAFVGSALRWGRLNELEMMGFYELKNSLGDLKRFDFKAIVNELLSQMKFARPMLAKGRMHFGFQTSRGRGELKKLLKKAKERKK
jgi:heterodisulfide reductase subunit C